MKTVSLVSLRKDLMRTSGQAGIHLKAHQLPDGPQAIDELYQTVPWITEEQMRNILHEEESLVLFSLVEEAHDHFDYIVSTQEGGCVLATLHDESGDIVTTSAVWLPVHAEEQTSLPVE